MAKLVVRQGRNIDAEHPIPSDGTRTVLGRANESDIQVLDTQASREHAEIVREGGRFRLSDLGSANGTRLNGRPVRGETELRFGDKIQIGETVLQFVPEAREEADGDFESMQTSGDLPAVPPAEE